MKKKRKQLKPKTKSILTILLVFAITACCLLTTIFGIGKQHKGKATHIELGLDLAGGVSVTYQVNEKDATDTQISDTIYKLQKRVEAYSTEAEVYKEGKDRITVEIPGVSDANEVLNELGKPGDLAFKLEDGSTVLTGSNIKSAEAETTDDNGKKGYVVALSMDEAGAEAFAQATADNIGKSIYIYYDDEIVSAPTVQAEISDGECVIEGMESYESAEQLASTIRIGALPLTLTELQSNVMGAKLGQDAVQSSLKVGAISVAVIILFMIAIYRFSGFVASLSLIGYIILNLLAINGFNATMTLPGIAGVLLAIGMAVDANVIIFTRIKEEIAAGRTVEKAIENGYKKATSAIMDGNVTTLIAAVILWWKGSGTVRGFAQTLGIGILISMFMALVVTKLLMKAFYELGVKDPKFYRKAKEMKVRDYVKASKYCIAASVFVIIFGLCFLGVNKKSIGQILNYDLEFSGGTSITMTLPEKSANDLPDQICQTVKDVTGAQNVQSQKVLSSDQLIVKTKELTVDQREELQNKIEETYEVKDYQTEEITASVSKEMKSDAVVAILISAICMLIYIAIRFRNIRFGASAVIALLHDVMIVFAVYSVCRLSVGNTFIACMLTILGYSINATIVIFDRIRENMKDKKLMKDGLKTVVNTSISQTMTRSLNTTITSFIPVCLLYFLGVASIREFTLTLMCGVIFGAYSSICITGPIWYFMSKSKKK